MYWITTYSDYGFGPTFTGMAGPCVLVVEDDASVQHTLCATLTLLGFRTHHAESVEAALRILGTEHVDAVTLDIKLSDPKGLQRSGLNLLAFLRATPDYENVPVLIFTGMPLSPDDEVAAQKQNAHIFYKPQLYAVLVNHLNLLLNREPAASMLPDDIHATSMTAIHRRR